MSGLRYDWILASTALAVILAAPLGAAATPVDPAPKMAAVPTAPATTAQPGDAPATPDALPPEIAIPASPAAAPAIPAAAAEPPAAPDPLASLDPADRPIAEKLRDLLAAKADRFFASKKERTEAEAFYRQRNHAPFWLDKGAENARAKAVNARLKSADKDGLDINDYRVPSLVNSSGPEALAEAELKLTQVVLTYARHLQAGRFPYQRISNNNMELPQLPPETAAVLAKLAEAADAGEALEEFSPPHAEYKALRKVLAELRGKSGSGGERIADGPLLKLNPKAPMEDARVPQLRQRLGVAGSAGDLKYDAKLAEAVKKFQRGIELPVTGNLDSQTVKELNGPARNQQIDLIIANMERWRWYPRDLGKAYSMVNQPDFTLKVVKNDAVLWTTRVVIGKPATATPLLSNTMKHITVNPTWNVPPSIVHNEYLPALQQDPTVLHRMGLRVVYNRDGSIHIYQPPGEANALGRIRFNFPNRFLVYQHDTNEKHYFGQEVRAYSHGCMRVQDPARYAEVLLSIALPNEGYTQERIKRMYGTSEQDIHFPQPIPVHLTYQSAFVDDAGKLQIRRDVYGLDSRLIAAIKSERGVVEPPQERAKEIASSSQRRPVPRTVSFFEQLFGHPVYQQGRPTPPRRVAR